MSKQVGGLFKSAIDSANDSTLNSTTASRRDTAIDQNNSAAHKEFLSVLGGRVRKQRDSVRMSRRVLSQRSKVSERYLAQLESGKGNMSIGLLRNVSIALGIPLAELIETRSSL